jgi:anaerobic glycerol-3-phosphate dehydrogenase
MQFLVALGMLIAAPMQPAGSNRSNGAPPEPPTAKYCLLMEPITGTRIATVQCRTRADWAENDIDVDQEWRENGVGVIA